MEGNGQGKGGGSAGLGAQISSRVPGKSLSSLSLQVLTQNRVACQSRLPHIFPLRDSHLGKPHLPVVSAGLTLASSFRHGYVIWAWPTRLYSGTFVGTIAKEKLALLGW